MMMIRLHLQAMNLSSIKTSGRLQLTPQKVNQKAVLANQTVVLDNPQRKTNLVTGVVIEKAAICWIVMTMKMTVN
jgi:hypothetical protein